MISLRTRRTLLPYLLLVPGLGWLLAFFLAPILVQAWVSLHSGNLEEGFQFNWAFHNYTDAVSSYSEQFLRSFEYAGVATVLALIISFPLAYYIAFKSRRKNLLLLLIILPFFTSYLVRTIAWQTILSDDGFVVNTLQSLGLLSADGRLLATRTAVIAGITYNFLPFMALPLYVSLEKIDRRLIEAATDLYASRWTAFRKVTVPLALPGIFAGSLLTFIPAVGDFINAQFLGTTQQYMIGNVIQAKFLTTSDYPAAAALSFTLMAVILVAVFTYAKLLGTRNLTEAAV
jgi:spermidine/putrescine transport system permease protein